MQVKRVGARGLAAISAVALILGFGSTPAIADVGDEFAAPVVSAPQSTYPSTSTTKALPVIANVTGPEGFTYTYSDVRFDPAKPARVKLVAKNPKAKYANISEPWLTGPRYASLGDDRFTLKLARSVTPGRYQVIVPVTQFEGNSGLATKVTAHHIDVRANTATSRATSAAGATARPGRAFTMWVNAPAYQSGATVTAYVKLKGRSSYRKAASGVTLSAVRGGSKANIRIPSTYSKSGARFLVKVSAAPYAPAYQLSAYISRP